MVGKNPHVIAFGNRIREIRRQKGISQEKLALISEVDRSYMGRLERGELNPTLTKIYQLSEALEIDIIEFFKPPTSTNLTTS